MSISISLQNYDMLEAHYARWQKDPASVEPEWAAFFEGFELGAVHAKNELDALESARKAEQLKQLPVAASSPSPSLAIPEVAAPEAPVPFVEEKEPEVKIEAEPEPAPLCDSGADPLLQRQVDMLVYTYRDLGHTVAKLDPLASARREQPLLELSEFGLREEDLDKEVCSKYYLRGEKLKLRDLIASLRRHYCSTVGVEFMHIQNLHVRHWMRDRFEARTKTDDDPQELRGMLKTLIHAETFERFLHTKFVGQKRFSLEGGESLMVILEGILERCPVSGIEEIVMGMAHRGRLNVLSNFFKKSPKVVFSEFSENFMPHTVGGDGDVKYHLGYESIRTTDGGQDVEIRLAANPSHLEAVDPVVQGKVRARQRIRKDTDNRKKVLPLLVHGDAAFAGQGLIAEVFNMSQLSGYRTGGTVHIIVNNQIGFTTMPSDARSTAYATDIAKMIEAPILHVNGDDPAAVAFVTKLALDFRQKFGSDVVIDLYCYRRHGHNEGDEPIFTQPRLYEEIQRHSSVSHLFRESLLESNVIEAGDAEEIENAFRRQLEADLDDVKRRELEHTEDGSSGFLESNAVFQPEFSFEPVDTAIPRERLEQIVNALTTVPDTFNILPKVRRILLDRRRNTFDKGGPYDWAFGEALAFGSLLLEETPVRLSGQDSRRGTFSQRHSFLYDSETAEEYVPLRNLGGDQAQFCAYNSLLSEAGVLGFDYGYSLDFPSILCIWEAQFGDFANGAQVIIDQFIASAEAKWQRPSGIVMLLPHGYEGQGPEHSSARIERYLQLCANNNIQVCYPTTPAQYFHLLRRQMKRSFKKPLVVMTPKSLLRSPQAVSSEMDFTQGQFHEILDSPLSAQSDPTEIKRLVCCTGKIYYDLLTHAQENDVRDTALIRIEQLYPFNEDRFVQVTSRYPNIDRCIWAQEEPLNMGAWNYIGLTICSLLDLEVSFAGRPASASTAAGSLARHRRSQREVLEQAFSI